MLPPVSGNARLLQARAQEALAANAVLDFDGTGAPILKARTWHGRAVLWLKDHFVPGHRRQRRQRTHHALAAATKQAYRNQRAAKQKQRGLFSKLIRRHAHITTRPAGLARPEDGAPSLREAVLGAARV